MVQEPFLEPARVGLGVLDGGKENAQVGPVVDLDAGDDEVEEERRAQLVLGDLGLYGGEDFQLAGGDLEDDGRTFFGDGRRRVGDRWRAEDCGRCCAEQGGGGQ